MDQSARVYATQLPLLGECPVQGILNGVTVGAIADPLQRLRANCQKPLACSLSTKDLKDSPVIAKKMAVLKFVPNYVKKKEFQEKGQNLIVRLTPDSQGSFPARFARVTSVRHRLTTCRPFYI
ncbi:hypothetical protein Y032_0342g3029 [Ancylostoma ceylanicum]|uniref:Uncharacterized protein n=1 Tax=Ancylostoma ceylanicum TaxID=53326 RepID=A0A016RXL0_9BILA|nr:hypothetical protein Y032_0342g3029 [Ancylostoma ceylanicum]